MPPDNSCPQLDGRTFRAMRLATEIWTHDMFIQLLLHRKINISQSKLSLFENNNANVDVLIKNTMLEIFVERGLCFDFSGNFLVIRSKRSVE